MPSNKELATQAAELAEKLGLGVVTDGKNNAQLAELVSDLKAKAKDAETDTEADTAEAEAAAAAEPETDTEADEDSDEPEADPEPVKHGVFVANGKSIAGERGIMKPGDEVKPGDLSDKAVASFLKTGYLVRY